MHYRNGREAKNGDKVVQLGFDGSKITAVGVLYDATPGNDYCNGQIAPVLRITILILMLVCSTTYAAPINPPVRFAQAKPFRTCFAATRDRLEASCFHSRNSVRALLGLRPLKPGEGGLLGIQLGR